ncbi:DUF421 domain-containing protein [Bacillus fonticola]|uniref:DUF421 domain-containing protein n=1 Tax=Bacillus fonticola TaxID=2728853 RepID=UPI001473DCB7|nr:DUF421 domain-containing protein [Bacillus fonticola]
MPPHIDIVGRSIFLIVALFFITKILGKKQLAKLSFFEYVAGIAIGDIASTLSFTRSLSFTEGLTSLAIWSLVPILINYCNVRFRSFRHFIEGKPTVFIEDGNIIEANMRKENYSGEELLEQLRKKSVFQLSDVEFASLDTNGDLSVLLKRERQPLTYGDYMSPPFHQATPPQAIIDNGKWDVGALETLSYTKDEVTRMLQNRRIQIEDIYLAQMDEEGTLVVDLLDEKIFVQQKTHS